MGCGASKQASGVASKENNNPAQPVTLGYQSEVTLTKISDSNRPMPSMVWDPSDPLIPPQDADVDGKITVVLDLDETLIHAEAQQSGPPEVTPRQHVSKLLEVANGCCEAVVWTASSRLQAHVSFAIACTSTASGCQQTQGYRDTQRTCA